MEKSLWKNGLWIALAAAAATIVVGAAHYSYSKFKKGT